MMISLFKAAWLSSVQLRSDHMLRNGFDSLEIRLILVTTSVGYFGLSGYLIAREQGISLTVLTILACALAYAGIACLTPKDHLKAGNWYGLVVTLIGGGSVLASLHLEYIIDSEWYFFRETKFIFITLGVLLILIDIWLPWVIKALEWKISYLWVCVGCVFLTLIFASAMFSHEFDSKAKFVGDIKEYQSLAVNWAKGHGLRYGGMEDIEIYQFHNLSEEDYINFKRSGEREGYDAGTDFYRTPGYPIFLGVVYKIVGISPWAAKRVQYLLIAISCGLLPLIGFHYWGLIGALSGVVSAVFAFQYYAEGVTLADRLMTETLITFFLVVLVCFFILWKKYTGPWTSFFLGVMLGACLLVKTSLIFLPALFVAYCGWNMRRRNVRWSVRYTMMILAGALLVTGAWSVHASLHVGKPVFISVQAGLALKGGNNEWSFSGTGADNYTWQENESSFYYRPEIRSLPESVQVLLFWKEHLGQMPSLVHKKIRQAFDSPALYVTSIFFLLECFFSLTRYFRGKARQLFRVLAVIGILSSAIFVSPLNAGPIYIYSCLLLYCIRVASRSGGQYLIPMPLALIFFNFLLITIIVFGLFRFIVVMEWVFILMAISYCATSIMFALEYLYQQRCHSNREALNSTRAIG